MNKQKGNTFITIWPKNNQLYNALAERLNKVYKGSEVKNVGTFYESNIYLATPGAGRGNQLGKKRIEINRMEEIENKSFLDVNNVYKRINLL